MLHPLSKPADTGLHSLLQVLESLFCGNMYLSLPLSWLEVHFVWQEQERLCGRTLLVLIYM